MHIPIVRNRQRGDTMVEVLIAMAVVSMILGGAYVTTNRSLLATRSAQERAIALKLAESQIERLKGLAGDPNPARSGLVFSSPSPFCMSTTGVPVTTTNDDCRLGPDGVHTDTEPVFSISITRTGNDFVLEESWFDVNGKSTDKLQLRYRVYE